MGMQKIVSVLAVFAMMLAMSGLAFAAVPDKLVVSEQPETLDADGVSCTDVTAQLMAVYADGHEEPVKMCGIEVQCKSHSPNILHTTSTGGAIVVDGATVIQWTNEFGKAKMEFCSTGSEEYNIGDVDVTCRALQLEEAASTVHVKRKIPKRIVTTMCPQSKYNELPQDVRDKLENITLTPLFKKADALADILADGASHVYITGQIKDENESVCGDNPIIKAGTMSFKTNDTNIVKTCKPPGIYYNMQGQKMTVIDDGNIVVETDNGVALAEFCSGGSGSTNVGSALITVERDSGYLNVVKGTIVVTTTSESGSTYKDGYLAMSAMPDQILADGESCLKVCGQMRDQDYRIITDLGGGETVEFESEDTNIIEALYPSSSTDAGLNISLTDNENIAIAEYCSAGKFDSLNVGPADIRGSTIWLTGAKPKVTVNTRTTQIWPTKIEGKATMPTVLCDGVSEVTVTAQLLDRCNLSVKKENVLVNFHSNDIRLLKNTDSSGQPSVITALTDQYGKAKATFITTDCKSVPDGVENVDIDVSTMSPVATIKVPVHVVKPRGFVPDGVNVYTDQNALVTSHAKPYLILADGDSPTEVTAQVCEMVHQIDNCNSTYPDKVTCEAAGDVIGRPYCAWNVSGTDECEMDPNYVDFCNPVKRCNMEIQFEIQDTHVVENAGDNKECTKGDDGFYNMTGCAVGGTHDGDEHPSYVKMLTDSEGKATAIFRSTGNAPSNKNKCTSITVTGKDGVPFAEVAYATVCSKGVTGQFPNALWAWAEPAFITADGVSHTEVRAALYYCYGELPIGKNQMDFTYLYDHCKPIKKQGVNVKFETMNTDALDDGMSGYKIYDTTDQYGQAHATFQSKGFDTQHMNPAEIQVWTLGSGENVIQLNTLIVGLEEKTWPWCPPYSIWFDACDEATGAAHAQVVADVDHDQYITDNELIEYIMNVWMSPYVCTYTGPYHCADNPCTDAEPNQFGNDDVALLEVILAWSTQL